MDSRGMWHKGDEYDKIKAMIHGEDEAGPDEINPERTRPVIEIGIGEKVQIITVDNSLMDAVFESCEKNKVTLKPCYENPGVYLEFGSTVDLRNVSGASVKAQVWDNRHRKIILRTLPV